MKACFYAESHALQFHLLSKSFIRTKIIFWIQTKIYENRKSTDFAPVHRSVSMMQTFITTITYSPGV